MRTGQQQFSAETSLLGQVDSVNSQVAARMASPFTQWRQFDTERQDMMKKQAQRIADTKGLSENVFEILQKSLA